ncbi:hypothetical protein RUM44_003850 [Polyplax serrata]|uniref:Serpin domain-containing protein n=1 Tax=Polyplax serrata TaxID=468196 RepID=A0ABR1B149_POLSC
MKAVLWVILPAVVFCQCISEDDNKVPAEGDARLALIKGQQRFSIDLLKILNDQHAEQNIFFSPHSIYQSLLLSYIISSNHTEKAIQKALYLPETENKLSIVQSYGLEKYFQYMRELNGSTDYEFSTCNKMFIAENVKPRDCILKLLKDELETVNMKDTAAATHYVNSWVEEKTKRHIKELIPEDGIHEDTKAILANAAYFKGLWKSRFLVENTKKNSLFYVSSDDIKIVDLMTQKGTFNHMTSEKLKAHILELPYKGDEVSMIIILPRFENNAIDKLIQQLSEESLQDVIDFDSLFPRQVEVEMPKFFVEKSVDLRPIFDSLGLSELFNSDADFSTLTGDAETIHFSDAVHKAKVEVDEEGTVAAAATAIFTFRSSRPLDPTRFIANHPFVYFIYDKMSQNILFMGVYKVPDKKYRNGKKITS